MPLPITGERKTFVKSIKPRGVKVALPILKKSGEGGSPPLPCWGSAAAADVADDEADAAGTVGNAALAVTTGVLAGSVSRLDASAFAVAEGALPELSFAVLVALLLVA